MEDRFWLKVDVRGPDECWEWQEGRDDEGYGRFHLSGGHVRAHRFALALVLDRPIRDGYLSCHTCDNPPCCNPAHLFEGTVTDNNQDKVAKGRHNAPAGLDHWNAQLDRKQVDELRTLWASGQFSQRALGERFGISQQTASKIIRYERWK